MSAGRASRRTILRGAVGAAAGSLLPACGATRASPAGPLLLRVLAGTSLGPYARLSGVQGSPYPEVPEDVPHVEAYRASAIEAARFPQDCPANELTLAAIFPDERADPDDPASYDFSGIDRHVQAARDAGLAVLWQSSYDVGLSDSWDALNLRGRPIRDLDLWARVLSRCLEHFTVGWAGGFSSAIRDVEFLNEPNGLGGYGGQWDAMVTAFQRFLDVVAVHNERHPTAAVRAVGPGLPFSIAEWGTFRPGLEGLMSIVEPSKLHAFSFHTYGGDTSPVGNARLASALRAALDAHGHAATELWNTEWQATEFLRAHLSIDDAMRASATPEMLRLYAQAVASYALSCKCRWQGVLAGSYYYRAGLRAWPPGREQARVGDGSAGFFSPEGRVGALALAEQLTARIAQRTSERCATELEGGDLLCALGLRSDRGAGVLVASLEPDPVTVRTRFEGVPEGVRVATLVRIDTDAQRLATSPLALMEDGGTWVLDVPLGPLECALVELG